MIVTVEISYYPLQDNYEETVVSFIEEMLAYPGITLVSGVMSSLVTGEYEVVMSALKVTMHPYLEKYPSVFKLTVASACNKCETR